MSWTGASETKKSVIKARGESYFNKDKPIKANNKGDKE